MKIKTNFKNTTNVNITVWLFRCERDRDWKEIIGMPSTCSELKATRLVCVVNKWQTPLQLLFM